jgi:hypothetical protein
MKKGAEKDREKKIKKLQKQRGMVVDNRTRRGRRRGRLVGNEKDSTPFSSGPTVFWP